MENENRNGSCTKKRCSNNDHDKRNHEPRIKCKKEIKQVGDSSDHKSLDLRSRRQAVKIHECPDDEELSGQTLLTYPPNSGRSRVVSLIASDIETLNPKELINDQVVDFWLQYLYREKLTEKQRSRSYVFSSYFFPSLQMGSDRSRSHHQASMLRSWMKNVNIFSKDFLFVPISLRSHWFLAVICFPYLNLSPEMYDAFVPESSSKNGDVDILDNGDTDDDDEADVVKKSCILIFDSMKKYTTDHTLVYRTLWNFLTTECRRKNDLSAITFTAATMPACVVEVPQQPNKCDCGLFVFKYFESFFSSPIRSYEFPVASMKTWFSRKEVTNTRETIYSVILRLTKKYFPENLPAIPTLEYCYKNMSDDEESADTC